MDFKINYYSYDLGLNAFKNKAYLEAIKFMNKSMNENHLIDFFLAYEVRAHSYFNLKEYYLALKDFNFLIGAINDFDKEYMEQLYFYRSQVYFFLKKNNEAIYDLKSCIEINPNNIEASKLISYIKNLEKKMNQILLNKLKKIGDLCYEINTNIPFTGVTIWHYDNGQLKLKTNWKDGKQDGLHNVFHENGQLKEAVFFEKGKQNGLAKLYFENGQLNSMVNFSNGIENGLAKFYYENGQLETEINWNNGKQESYKTYFENGQLKEESLFVNGVKNGVEKVFFNNGQLKGFFNYKNDLKEGLSNIYFENGQLKSESNWIKGKKEGESIWYFENGQLQSLFNFSNGLEHGLFKLYHENGKLKYEGFYKDGKKIPDQ